jgi:hypothetical protein
MQGTLRQRNNSHEICILSESFGQVGVNARSPVPCRWLWCTIPYELSVFSYLEMKVRDDIIIGVVFPLVYIILRKIKGKDFLCD